MINMTQIDFLGCMKSLHFIKKHATLCLFKWLLSSPVLRKDVIIQNVFTFMKHGGTDQLFLCSAFGGCQNQRNRTDIYTNICTYRLRWVSKAKSGVCLGYMHLPMFVHFMWCFYSKHNGNYLWGTVTYCTIKNKYFYMLCVECSLWGCLHRYKLQDF